MQLSTQMKLVTTAAVLASAISFNVNAATSNYSVGFTTVPDVAISQIRALDFGVGLQLTAGGTCSMLNNATVADPGFVGNGDMRIAPG